MKTMGRWKKLEVPDLSSTVLLFLCTVTVLFIVWMIEFVLPIVLFYAVELCSFFTLLHVLIFSLNAGSELSFLFLVIRVNYRERDGTSLISSLTDLFKVNISQCE